MTESPQTRDGEGWTLPKPAHIPKPTYYPVLFALACIFIMFGVVTSWITSVVGALLFVVSLVGWIGDLRHDQP